MESDNNYANFHKKLTNYNLPHDRRTRNLHKIAKASSAAEKISSLKSPVKYIVVILLLIINIELVLCENLNSENKHRHRHHHHHHQHQQQQQQHTFSKSSLCDGSLCSDSKHASEDVVSSNNNNTSVYNYTINNSENVKKHRKKRDIDFSIPGLGTLSGEQNYLPNYETQVVSFLGIRYAEPPVGELRFKKPKKAKLLGGLMDTLEWANSCFQPTDNNFGNFFGSNMWNPNTPMDEDCLFLNVFVPQYALEGKTSQKLSVMIWIYGGGFYSGTSSLTMYDGKSLAASNGVIVVTINYRVGIWGFFGLGNSETPTNVGLWDQLLALEWVNTHIHGFNGDPNSVTLFGESAGAVSVSLHLLSPLSWKYFNRAIMQSGTANMPWAVMTMNETIRRSKALVEALNCNNSRNIASEIKCMREVSNDKIIDNQWVSRGFVQFPFGPTIDGEFLTEHPDELLRKGLFKKCPILLGSNANEASFFLIYEFGELLTLNSLKMSQKNATDCINSVYNYYPQFPKIIPSDVLKAINFYYTHETEESAPDLEHFKNLDEAASDGQFLCPLNEFSKAFVESDLPVYMYYFTERLDNHLWPSYMGVLHADEIFFMFSDEIQTRIKFTERETGFSRLVSKLWANFAKFEKPSAEDWLPSRPGDYRYLELNSTLTYLKVNFGTRTKNIYELTKDALKPSLPRARECRFWKDYVTYLMNNENNECPTNSKQTPSHSTKITLSTFSILCSLQTIILLLPAINRHVSFLSTSVFATILLSISISSAACANSLVWCLENISTSFN